jgi:hypothetical protein
MDNIIGTHLDINDRKNHALLVISAFFRLCIVNKDTGMLTFLFKTLLKQVPYSLNHLINAFLEHIELKSQLENIEWLADFVAKKLSLDILNTYYTLFSAALQAYDEAKRVRFVENLALWVSNREGTSIETTFKIIMDHSTNTITVNNYTIRQNLHPFFKGFSNAGVSYDVIRNYSEDGEDWYTEKILSVPMFKQLYHLSDER